MLLGEQFWHNACDSLLCYLSTNFCLCYIICFFFQLCYAEEDDDLDVNIEALTRRALRRLCGELTLLEEQGKEGEERVLVDLPLVSLELGLGGGRAS